MMLENEKRRRRREREREREALGAFFLSSLPVSFS
jgi:hypothetical protein